VAVAPSSHDWWPEDHLDGTKQKANASKHEAMNYGRMVKEKARLTAEVKRPLPQAEAADVRRMGAHPYHA
jgi:hypothetical protein